MAPPSPLAPATLPCTATASTPATASTRPTSSSSRYAYTISPLSTHISQEETSLTTSQKDGPQSWQIGFTQATWIPAGTGRVGELQQIAGANLKDPCHALCDQCRTGESEEFVQDGSYMNVRAILSSLIALPPPRPMYPAAADDRRVQMSNLDCAPQPGDNVAQHCKNPGSIQVTIRGGPYPVVKFPRAC